MTQRDAQRHAGTLAVLAWLFLIALPISAQEPPDTLIIGAPTADTLGVSDTLGIEGDSVSADTIFYNMPTVRGGPPPGFATGSGVGTVTRSWLRARTRSPSWSRKCRV